MEGQVSDEYLIIDYIDGIEDALSVSNEQGMSSEIVKGLENLHEEFVELGNMAETEEQYKRLKAEAGDLVDAIYKGCKGNDEGGVLASLKQFRDNIKTLKSLWGKK